MDKNALLSLALEDKIKQSKRLIMDWYYQFEGQVYVAYSGGKDSTVLLHLVRTLFPDVVAVFCDTGLEYPEIREFVKKTDNVEWVKPKLTFKQVIERYGYPVISKEQSQYIEQYRTAISVKTKNTRLNGNKWGRGKISNKWRFLIHAPFKISDKCCTIMKKNPSKLFEKKTGLKPFVGVMAKESALRMSQYYKGECNMYKNKRPISKPIVFWSDSDIWEYIRLHNIPYCPIYDKGFCRTGCMFCMYGCHNKDDNRFVLMEKTHPTIYKYCMEKLGLQKVLSFIQFKGTNNLFE